MVKSLFKIFGGKPEVDGNKVEVAAVAPVVEIEELTEEDRLFAKDILQKILDQMGFMCVVKIEAEPDGTLLLNIKCEDVAPIIGKEGATLNALQTLIKNIVQTKTKKRSRLLVDANEYRKKRGENIENKALRAAQIALEENKEVKLPPMPAFERRLVHMALESDKRIQTFSIGEKDNRRVVIAPRDSHFEGDEDNAGNR